MGECFLDCIAVQKTNKISPSLITQLPHYETLDLFAFFVRPQTKLHDQNFSLSSSGVNMTCQRKTRKHLERTKIKTFQACIKQTMTAIYQIQFELGFF
ncbi:hypothetical protein FKM82_004513 [Ascaphus truei]